MLRLVFLMNASNGIGDKIHINDVYFVRRTKWKHGKPGEENKRLHHVELRRLGMTAVAQNDTRTKDRARSIRKQYAHHVLAKLLGARVGIVVGTVPLDRPGFGHHFVAAPSGY